MKKNKKKIKENPIMVSNKKAKNLKIDDASDSSDIKSFIIILVVMVVIIGIIYGVTEIFKNKNVELPKEEVTAGKINYDKITVGTLLNRPYDKYYVLAYSTENSDATIYSTLIANYTQNSSKKDYVKMYFCDLANHLNQPYFNKNNDGKSNPKATKIDELNFGELTLLRVEKGKIVQYVEGFDEIKKMLNKAK